MGNNDDKFLIDLKTGEIGEVKTIEYYHFPGFSDQKYNACDLL